MFLKNELLKSKYDIKTKEKITLAWDFTLYYFISYLCKEKHTTWSWHLRLDIYTSAFTKIQSALLRFRNNLLFIYKKQNKTMKLSGRKPGWHTEGGNHISVTCAESIYGLIYTESLRGRCKYRNYTHAYFTGIPQIAHLAGCGDRPAPNLCLHRRQQKKRLCHVCAEKLGHEKATSFPPLRGRIHSLPTASTSWKLFGNCN